MNKNEFQMTTNTTTETGNGNRSMSIVNWTIDV